MQTDNSKIKVHSNGGFTLTGDAVSLFRVLHIKKALELYNRCGMLTTRGATPKHLLALATEITQQKYANNKAGRKRAIAALQQHCDLLSCSIPRT